MDWWGEILALGIDAIVFGCCAKAYMNCSFCVGLIERAQRLGVNPDVSKLSEEDKKYAIYQGEVEAIGKTIRSTNQEYTGVLLRKSIKEHAIARNASGFWSDQKSIIHVSHNVVPFIIKRGKIKVEILDPVSAELLDLDTVFNQFENTSLGLTDFIFGFFNGVRQRGIETTEELLKEGTRLTAIGEVSSSPKGILQMSPPSKGYPYFLTTMPISSLVRRIEEERALYKWLSFLFGSIGVGLSYYMFKKWWNAKKLKEQNEQMKRKLEETRKERRKNVRNTGELSDNETCVACKENPKEIIILPCGHVCLCEDCSDHIQDLCPVCRLPIGSKAAAFIT